MAWGSSARSALVAVSGEDCGFRASVADSLFRLDRAAGKSPGIIETSISSVFAVSLSLPLPCHGEGVGVGVLGGGGWVGGWWFYRDVNARVRMLRTRGTVQLIKKKRVPMYPLFSQTTWLAPLCLCLREPVPGDQAATPIYPTPTRGK